MEKAKTCDLPHPIRKPHETKIGGVIAKLLGSHRTMSVHAHGLSYPSHMEWTKDGRLLVSEFLGGNVKDITKGGDARKSKSFASHLGHPASLLTDVQDDKILVVDNGRGKIYDITNGGDVKKAPVIFSGIPGPYGLVSHGKDVFSTFSNTKENGLVKVVKGGKFSEDLIITRGFPRGVRETADARMEGVEIGDCGSWSARSVGNRLLYLHSGLGIIFDLENQENNEHFTRYSTDIPIVAQGLNKPLGFIAQHVDGEDVLFVAERFGHAVKVVPPNSYGIDMRFIPPVATGFREPSCLRFSSTGKEMYVCDFAGGVVWRVDFE